MAKKPAVTKTQAVRDYLKAHRGAMSKEIAAALNKQGIKITPGHVANIKTKINAERAKKPKAVKAVARVAKASAPVAEPAPAVAEKPASTITIEQIKAVVQTVKLVGGADRLNELLGLVKEVGGVKKFKELLDAISG